MKPKDKADFLEWMDSHPGEVDGGKVKRLARRSRAIIAAQERKTLVSHLEHLRNLVQRGIIEP